MDTDGSFDRTEYFYSSTTGLLEKVRYYRTGGYDEAEYTYDDMARLVQLDYWLGGNGVRYEYDAAGRMTVHTDYDDSELEYAYDANGNVTQMTDYHGNVTSYVYDDANRLYTMTAPGSKKWTFAYNALNQPTAEILPNGMASFYTYDSAGRKTEVGADTDGFSSCRSCTSARACLQSCAFSLGAHTTPRCPMKLHARRPPPSAEAQLLQQVRYQVQLGIEVKR